MPQDNRRKIQAAYDQADKVGRRQKNTASPGTITGRASQVADYRANNARTPPMNQVTEASGAPGTLSSGASRAGARAGGALSRFAESGVTSSNAGPPPTVSEQSRQWNSADAIRGQFELGGPTPRRSPGPQAGGASGQWRSSGATGSFTNEAGPQYPAPSMRDTPTPPTTAELIQMTVGSPRPQRQEGSPVLSALGGVASSANKLLSQEFSLVGGGAAGGDSATRRPQIGKDNWKAGTPWGLSLPSVPDWVLGGPSTLSTGAATSATGRGQNTPSADPRDGQTAMGYWSGPDGRKNFIPGTQPNSGPGSGISVVGNMGAANQQFAEANRIRQETIDSQRPQNQVTIIPDSGAARGGVDGQIERLVRSAGSTRDPWQRAAINKQISQLQQVADRGATQQTGAADRQGDLDVQQLRNQGALAAASQGGSVNPYDFARAQQVQQEMVNSQNPFPTAPPAPSEDRMNAIALAPESVQPQLYMEYMQELDKGRKGAMINQQIQSLGYEPADVIESWRQGDLEGDPLGDLMNDYFTGVMPTTENMAMGGLVPEFSAISFAQGGMVPEQYGAQMGPGMDMGSAMGMGAPGMGGIDLMQVEYDQYSQGAQQLGVPAIPFEEFVGLKQQSVARAPQAPGAQQPMTGAMQSAIGMAAGGTVPGMDDQDASGKMLMDPDPNAPQDSIPAVIDGTRPAKLDSGEFVIPKHAVMWHGIDKLQKLIAQAEEKGQANGTESGTASAAPSAAQR